VRTHCHDQRALGRLNVRRQIAQHLLRHHVGVLCLIERMVGMRIDHFADSRHQTRHLGLLVSR
jgi:hypothetical protein